jgi:GntR family transcriptional regulator
MAAEPRYRDIAEDLRRKIECGDVKRGGRLPTEIELMEEYDASRNTVRDAVKLLIARHLVETRPGQGTFVVAKITPFVSTLTGNPDAGGAEEHIGLAEAKASGRTLTNTPPRVEIQEADAVIAKSLQIAVGDEVVIRHQQRFLDNIPWSLQSSFYPMSLTERGAGRLIQPRDIEGGTVKYLADKCRIKQVGYSDRIRVRPPDETETAFFKLPPDGRVSMFEITRIAYEEKGQPFRCMVTVYPSDRNQFVINVGDTPPNDGEEGGSHADGAASSGERGHA